MKILSLCEISACEGGLVPCTCYKQNKILIKYEGSQKMFKTIMCWHNCCNNDGADSYQWGDGDKEKCQKPRG